MGRREKFLGLAALLTALAAFHGWGWCVLLYPAFLAHALTGLPPRRRIALAALWGVLFAAAFYHWVGSYGLLPWLALALVRGLPWALYPLPTLLLERRFPQVAPAAKARLPWSAVMGNSLGFALVSLALLSGLTGVDWETPAGALAAWPFWLAPLRAIGLVGVALALGLASHLLGSGRLWGGLAGGGLLAAWAGLCLAFPLAPTAPFPLPVALLQTGFSQDEKWDSERRASGVESLLGETEKAAARGARLVIWPETAWPYRGMRRRVTNTRRIGKTARRLGVDILATSIEELPGTEPPDWSNSASLVAASGKFTEHYSKRRLAPFAEYMPLPRSWAEGLRGVDPFSSISRFVPGDRPTIFTASTGQRFAVLICYESMSPAMAAEMAPQVDFLVVVTNDAPFASGLANEAHFRSAILRAIETGKPVLQAANTGVTGAVGADGQVLTRTPPGISGPSVQYLAP